jgi:hypothetical protein
MTIDIKFDGVRDQKRITKNGFLINLGVNSTRFEKIQFVI